MTLDQKRNHRMFFMSKGPDIDQAFYFSVYLYSNFYDPFAPFF